MMKCLILKIRFDAIKLTCFIKDKKELHSKFLFRYSLDAGSLNVMNCLL